MKSIFRIYRRCGVILSLLLMAVAARAQKTLPRFHVLALSENGGWHIAYSKAATVWLNKLALDSNFSIHYIHQTDSIDDQYLSKYQLFIQLDYPPYGWAPKAVQAFQRYIEQGKGGWIGFHHATLLGEFDGYPMWDWFSRFMGGIRYKNYIPTFAAAEVEVEDTVHPLMRGLPKTFIIRQEEWYTYNKSPRPNVHVLATVNEDSYVPDSEIKMHGDHPVVWINEKMKARNVYIFMGHSPLLFENQFYTRLFSNAIFWASQSLKHLKNGSKDN